MSTSNPSGKQELAAPRPRRRLLRGCLLVLVLVTLAGGAYLTWYYWPPASLSLSRVLKAHSKGVHTVAISPDGKRLATASYDGTAKLWNLEAPNEPAVLLTPGKPASSLAFSPDGRTLAVGGGRSGVITLCDAISGLQRLAWKGDKDDDPKKPPFVPGRPSIDMPPGATNTPAPFHPSVRSVAFSSDGRILASSGVSSIRIWDAETGRQKARCPTPPQIGFDAVAISPDGRLVASCGRGGAVPLWESATGKEWSTLQGQKNELAWEMTFSPDGKAVAVSTGDNRQWEWIDWGRINILDVADGKLSHDLTVGRTIRVGDIAYSPDGKLLACSGETISRQVVTCLFDTTNWRCIARAQADAPGFSLPQPLAFSPDGNQLVTGNSDGNVRFWDVSPYRSR